MDALFLKARERDENSCDAASSIHEDTLIIIDQTDVQKPYAEKMPYLAKVWDGSEGKVGDNLGYTLCMAIACENGCRRIVPLMLRLWSSVHPEYASENDEVCQVVGQIASATYRRGIFVCHGRWRGLDCVREKRGDLQMEFELLSG